MLFRSRYDRLLSQFGFPCPATGFALGLDRLSLVLKSQEKELPRFLVGGHNWQRVIQQADILRNEGKIVEMDVEGLNRDDLAEKIAQRPDYTLVYVEDDGQ